MKGSVAAVLIAVGFIGLHQSARGEEMVFCGWDEVFIADVSRSTSDGIEKLWSWRAADHPDLPDDFRALFDTTDDCKPVDGGSRILVSSSGGGLAVVERETGRVQWYGFVGNAHSIELLPDDRVVVAGSTHPEGNKVAVFDLDTPNETIFEEPLHSGHGVVWDQQREILWALGYDELRAYSLSAWQSAEPALDLQDSYPLPGRSGHDLMLIPSGAALLLTTNEGVHRFDIETRAFSPYEELKELRMVKSLSIHPRTGRLAYVQAEGEDWWARRVHFLNPEGTLVMEEEHLYKVRWVSPSK